MNYSLQNLPNSGQNPEVYMDISLNNNSMGTIRIKLFRDVFPAGVENFVKIASGKTYKIKYYGDGKYKYSKQTKRTFEDTKFFKLTYNNYIIGGDIYNNNGTNAGTIYNDSPIPPQFGDFYYPHEKMGLVSLIPFKDEISGAIYYDSTFMITLDDAKPSNSLLDLDDNNNIVIGQVYTGLDILHKINKIIKPHAGSRYPTITISKCGCRIRS